MDLRGYFDAILLAGCQPGELGLQVCQERGCGDDRDQEPCRDQDEGFRRLAGLVLVEGVDRRALPGGA